MPSEEGVAETGTRCPLKRKLALVVRSEGRCPDAQGLGLEDVNLFKDLMVELPLVWDLKSSLTGGLSVSSALARADAWRDFTLSRSHP